MASSDNQVIITLNLVGQKAAVDGLLATSEAVKGMATSVEDADVSVATSTETMASSVSASIDAMSAAVVDRTGTMAADVSASVDDMAAQVTTATDSIVASYTRMADASLTGAAGVAKGSAAASTSIMGVLGSMKTLVVGGMAYESIKAFSNYQGALTQLGTVAGLTGAQIASVNAQIGRTHTALGQSPKALAQAYYNPISEGFGVAGANNVVPVAAKLAGLAGAPLTGPEGTSYAVSTMMQTYGLKPTAANAKMVGAWLRGGVATGDMKLPQLLAANSTGYFNATQSYGVSEQSSMGALDFFSSQGVSPDAAATRLRMTLALLSAPSAKSSKYLSAEGLTTTETGGLQGQLSSLGLTSTKMAGVMRGPDGINQAIKMLVGASSSLSPDMQTALYSKVMGGGRSESSFLSLANHPALAESMYNRVGGLSTTAGFDTSWKQYQQTAGFQMQTLGSQFSALSVEIGKDLLPAFKGLVTVLGPLMKLASTKIGSEAIAALLVGTLGKQAGKILGLGGKIPGVAGSGAGAGAGGEAGGAGLLSRLGGAKALYALPFAAKYAEKQVASGTQAHILGTNIETSKLHQYPGLLGMAQHGDFNNAHLGHYLSDATSWIPGFASGGLMPQPPGYARGGFVTRGPTAIVGEGSSFHPEYVIPTDPIHRARAIGLYGQLGSQLLAAGGIVGAPIGGAGLAGAGSGIGLLGMLTQMTSGQPSAGLRAMLGSLGGAGAASIPHATSAVMEAIATAVPGGGFRNLMEAVVQTMFGAAGRAVTSTVGAAAAGAGLAAGRSNGSRSGNMALGQAMAAARGWTGQEWTALQQLWTKESGWSNTAANPSSGAYGIAQALPASKYPYAGQAAGGSQPRSQIGWGLNYIGGRYGDPLGAMAHEQSFNWYAKGGTIPQVKPLLFDTGGLLPEGINVVANQTGAPEPLARMGGGGGEMVYNGPQTVQVVLDGHVVGEATLKYIQGKVARR